jgi:hypothetical protein
MNMKCLLRHAPGVSTYTGSGCKQGYTCTRCGDFVSTGTNHKFSEWVVENPCIKHRICSRCGYKEEVEEKPVWESTGEELGADRYNCTIYGYRCKNCGITTTDAMYSKNRGGLNPNSHFV